MTHYAAHKADTRGTRHSTAASSITYLLPAAAQLVNETAPRWAVIYPRRQRRASRRMLPLRHDTVNGRILQNRRRAYPSCFRWTHPSPAKTNV